MAQINWTLTQGIPSDSVGNPGDMAWDTVGKFAWGPKGQTTWVGTANVFAGTPGAAGPPGALPVTTNMAAVYAPSVCFSGQTMGTTNGAANSIFNFAGNTVPNTFTPTANSYLVGLQATNHGATNATVYFYLMDLTANQIVFNYNSGNGIASGTVAATSYGSTTYPLIANHTYQWQGVRTAAGAAYVVINPIVLAPSGTPAALSIYPPFTLTTPATVANTASTITFAPGMSGYQQYYKNANPSWLYSMDVWIAGSGIVDPFLYNGTTSANHYVVPAASYITMSSTLTKYSFGPFAPNAWPFLANNLYYLNLYAPNGQMTVNQAHILITVGQ